MPNKSKSLKTNPNLLAEAFLSSKQKLEYRRFIQSLAFTDGEMPFFALLSCDSLPLSQAVFKDLSNQKNDLCFYRRDIVNYDDFGRLLSNLEGQSLVLDYSETESEKLPHIAELLLFFRDNFIQKNIHLFVLCPEFLMEQLYQEAYDVISAANWVLHLQDFEAFTEKQMAVDRPISKGEKEYQKAKKELEAALKKTKNERALMMAYCKTGESAYEVSLNKEALINLVKAKDLAERLNAKYYLGVIITYLGRIDENQGEFDVAYKNYQEALSLFQEIDDKSYELWVLNDIALLFGNQGEIDQALKYNQKVLNLAKEIQEPFREAWTLNNIGTIYRDKGEWKSALKYFKESKSLNDRKLHITALERDLKFDIAIVYLDFHDYPEALKYFIEVLGIDQLKGDKVSEGIVLGNIGEVYKVKGDLKKAMKFNQESYLILKEMSYKISQKYLQKNIAHIYQEQGNLTAAFENYKEALLIFQKIGIPNSEAETLTQLGEAYLLNQEYPKAQTHFQRALEIFQKIGAKQHLAKVTGLFGELALAQNELEKANKHFRDSLQQYRTIEDVGGELYQLNNIGEYHLVKDEIEEALQNFQAAYKIASKIGNAKGEAMTMGNLGRVYLQQKKPQAAKEQLQQSCDLFEVMGMQPKLDFYQPFLLEARQISPSTS